MAYEEKCIWGIHTYNDSLFLKDNLIAIGWYQMGDLSKIQPDRDSFKKKYMKTYPDAKNGSIATGAGMLYRFCHEIQVGDYVVFPSKSNREVNIGIVDGDYVYDPNQEEYVQTRKVKWLNVDHQLMRTSGMEYLVTPTKTNAGTRRVPMTKEVAACFERMIESRPALRKEPVIDGYTGFLCIDKNGMPKVAMHWEKYFKFVSEKHDRTCRLKFPKITPHVCRHTFCSNMARSGMNPKTLQYIMGHSDITVTMNTYTHVKYDDAKEEFARVTAIG